MPVIRLLTLQCAERSAFDTDSSTASDNKARFETTPFEKPFVETEETSTISSFPFRYNPFPLDRRSGSFAIKVLIEDEPMSKLQIMSERICLIVIVNCR